MVIIYFTLKFWIQILSRKPMTCITLQTGILHFTWSQELIVRLLMQHTNIGLNTYSLCPDAVPAAAPRQRGPVQVLQLPSHQKTVWTPIQRTHRLAQSRNNEIIWKSDKITNNFTIGDIKQKATRLWTVVLAGSRGCRWREASMIPWSTQWRDSP